MTTAETHHRFLIGAIVSIISLLASSAYATPPDYFSYRPSILGRLSCKAFINFGNNFRGDSVQKDAMYDDAKNWAHGYVLGNKIAAEPGSTIAQKDEKEITGIFIFLALDSYCRANPTKTIQDATESLLRGGSKTPRTNVDDPSAYRK